MVAAAEDPGASLMTRKDMSPTDAIRTLLARRRSGASICPSEAARLIDSEDWRPLMPMVRAAAAALADEGEIVVTQKNTVVDIQTARGPVRLRLRDE